MHGMKYALIFLLSLTSACLAAGTTGKVGTRVVIENCRIHHLLAGTYEQQHDAHGITGRWGDATMGHAGGWILVQILACPFFARTASKAARG
jgi:hypothetical protein